MGRMRMRTAWILPAALVAAGCATQPLSLEVRSQQAAAPVIGTERAFAARHQKVSLKKAFVEFSADDAISVDPDGIKNVHASFAARPDRENAGLIQWWPTFAGIARSGDLGFTTGPAIFAGGKSYSNYFTVWKKQPNGAWKWMIDLGTQEGVKPTTGPNDGVEVVPISKVEPMEQAAAWQDLLAVDTALGQALAGNAKALLTRLAPEAHLLGRQPEPSVGTAAITAALAQWPAQLTKPEGGGVSAAGDLGWTYGYASWKEEGVEKRGPYLRVWQRRPHAGWVILVDNVLSF
jgi:ketosteroid isomerase-like protein